MVVSGVIASVLVVMVVSARQILASEDSLATRPPKVICHYTDIAFIGKGPLQVGPEELIPALDKCTHLVYQYAQISKDFEIEALRPDISTESGANLFRKITDLKQTFPKLKVLISLAGADSVESQQRYIDVLREDSHQEKLVASVLPFLKKYNFDGINMAWVFPPRPDEVDKVKNQGGPPVVHDIDPEGTRVAFGGLVQHLADILKPENFITFVTVIPHVNYIVYYDIPTLSHAADMIIVESHDFPSPSSKYDLEDPSVPIYYVANKNEVSDIEKKIRYFLEKGADAAKLIISASSYGSWALVKKSDRDDSPTKPKQAVGGIVFYFEVCSQIKALSHPAHPPGEFLEKLNFNLGPRYFKESSNAEETRNQLKDDHAIWLAYENTQSVAYKTAFAKRAGLGGVALNALMFDDTRGVCSGVKYPLLETIATSWK